jgi:hypothetical protein
MKTAAVNTAELYLKLSEIKLFEILQKVKKVAFTTRERIWGTYTFSKIFFQRRS